jgi:MOSC domain-containing protein YiiM
MEVVAVALSASHTFSKSTRDEIVLVANHGVEGDAHAGATVKHRSRVRADATQPNLRQVHLIHAELHDELSAAGFEVGAGALGENITTRGIDLLGLSQGTELRIGDAVLEVTGLRNPCKQIEALQAGLLAAVVEKLPDGRVAFKAGVMAVVRSGGTVRPGDEIVVTKPPGEFRALERV